MRSNSKFAPKYFKVLALKSTKLQYALFEVKLLACCLEYVQRPKDTSPMQFNEVQRKALGLLREALMATPFDKNAAKVAMYAAFYAIYFPKDSTILMENVFASPWVSFLAYMFLNPTGGYHTIWRVPPFLSQAQYSARLRCAHYLKETLDEHCAKPDVDLESGEGDSWFE